MDGKAFKDRLLLELPGTLWSPRSTGVEALRSPEPEGSSRKQLQIRLAKAQGGALTCKRNTWQEVPCSRPCKKSSGPRGSNEDAAGHFPCFRRRAVRGPLRAGSGAPIPDSKIRAL